MNDPLLVAFCGPNGAGKSTLRNFLLGNSAFPFVNADVISAELGIGAYEAAGVAETRRRAHVAAGRSFSFETVLSDPVGAKVALMADARAKGYRVIVHFVGLPSADYSRARVAQRVMEGGHDVPDEKIASRYPRVLDNLRRLIGMVDDLTVYDNSSADTPYRIVAHFLGDKLTELSRSIPPWLDFLDLPARVTEETTRLP